MGFIDFQLVTESARWSECIGTTAESSECHILHHAPVFHPIQVRHIDRAFQAEN